MARLNEEQLLLLNSLVYVDDSIAPGHTVADIVNSIDVNNVTCGGGMSKEDLVKLKEAIASDEQLMCLEVSHYEDSEIRAACFVDPETEQATIAYRGTGPLYAAWDDNAQGGYMSDTDMQKQALAFAQECAEDYDNITVSGHSKGGNMAQYVTILMGDEIDRCVSYDGQGFGDEFRRKYKDEIASNKHKIRSVCAYNDYVNILLEPIAEETVYLDNQDFAFPGGHYVFALYDKKRNKLDSNGEYTQSRKQAWEISLLKALGNAVVAKVDSMGFLAPHKEFLIYSLFGMLLGQVSTEGKSIPEMIETFLKNIEEYIENIIDNITETDIQKTTTGKQNVSFRFAVNTNALQTYSRSLTAACGVLDDCRIRIESLKKKMSTNIIKSMAVGLPLSLVINQLESEYGKLNRLATTLESCAELYERTENEVRSLPG